MRAERAKQLLKNAVYRTIGETTTTLAPANGTADRTLRVDAPIAAVPPGVEVAADDARTLRARLTDVARDLPALLGALSAQGRALERQPVGRVDLHRGAHNRLARREPRHDRQRNPKYRPRTER